MKTLENNILLYDAECPMCRLYSDAFIKCGMLDKNGRMDYSTMTGDVRELVDADRARNEIALINTKNQTVSYGIDSLFQIIANAIPILGKMFANTFFHALMKRIYAFISFNRRVIVCGNQPENASACNPDFNLKYRIAYIVFATFISSVILDRFIPLLGAVWPIPKGIEMEMLLVLGQIFFQLGIIFCVTGIKNIIKAYDYVGNLMTVSLMGSLMLVPALLFSRLFPGFSYLYYLGWFIMVVAVMFSEHKRRVKIYKLPGYLSFTWLAYRLLASATGLILLTK